MGRYMAPTRASGRRRLRMADGRMEGMQRMPRLREALKGAHSREIPARGA